MRPSNLMSAVVLAAFVGFSAAQDPKPADTLKDAQPSEPPKKADVKEVKKPSPITAIVGADIQTVTRGVVRNGVVLIQDGKILRVGQDIAIPEGATRIDAAGKVLAPGFVAVSASGVAVRTLGNPVPAGGPPAPGGPPAGQARFADALNPFDRNIQFCLAAGITTACVEVAGGPGGRFGRDTDDAPLDDTRLCPCCGLAVLPTEPITPPAPTERTARRSAVVKMNFGELAGMLVKESPFYHVAPGAFAGPLSRHQWREQFKKARQQIKDHAAAAADEAGPGGMRRSVPDDVVKLAKKELPLRVSASSASQMRDMIALAKELDYNLVLDDVHEAWLIAGELGAAKVQTVLTPRSRRRHLSGREDTSGSSIETSLHLEKAGVPFAVAPLGNSVSLDGLPGRDLTSLPLEAAFAVRGGCSEQTALEALTIAPARMLGLGDRLGSIEEGKDADLVILDGHPLDYHTFVEKAFVNGRLAYDRTRENIFPKRD